MIPDFKTYIKESVWGDIYKRGAGEQVRKEDDVNLLDKEGFYEYILSHYDTVSKNSEITYTDVNMVISLGDGNNILLPYDWGKVYFYIKSFKKKYFNLYNALSKQFNVKQQNEDNFCIEPKGIYINQFYIDVLDCIIANTKKILKKKDNVNESIWGDIYKRGAGEQVRKEDDVNILDQDDFYNYLTTNYKITKPSFATIVNSEITKVIVVPVILYPFVETVYFNFQYKKIRVHYDFPYGEHKLFDKLTDNFIIKQEGHQPIYLIYPKDGSEVTNQFFLDFIDFVLENIPANARGIEKIDNVNESIWGDIYKRGAGEQIRKEDIIRPFDKYELIECIKQQYEKQGKGENLDLTMIDVSDVEDMSCLFTCLFSSWDSWDNSQTIKHIDMSNWDVSHVKDMTSMFYGCVSIESLEVSDWDVSSVIMMTSMFQNCNNLESIDVSKWKMSSAINFYSMFFHCKKLKTLDVSNWDVSNVEVMDEMFSGCEELESLDISNWKPNKLRTAKWMFYGCKKLQPVDVSKWDKQKQNKMPARYRKITESVWGDIYKRGAGEQIRREDDIDNLSNEELYEYIKEKYPTVFEKFDIDYFGAPIFTPRISIPLYVTMPPDWPACFLGLYLYREPDDLNRCMELHINTKIFNTFKPFIKKLQNKYNSYTEIRDDYKRIYLTPKDGRKITNNLFVKLLNFCLDNFTKKTIAQSDYTIKLNIEKKINESVWGDIYKRGAGEQERKEDDVNLMDKDGFFDYLTKHYNIDAEYYMFKDANNAIVIPYYLIKSDGNYNFIYYYTDNNEVSLGFRAEKISPDFTRKLRATYATSYVKHQFMNDLVVKPKNGEKSSNKFLLEVMDFLIDNTPKNCHCCIVKKNINESVWGDIYKRGAGEQIRKDEPKLLKLFEEIQKIPDSELFEIKDKHTHLLWTPYNFGAKSESEPGLYLDGDEILELAEYLDGTEYHMATQADWIDLNALSKYHYDYTKINGYWTYVFTSTEDENKKLYVPNFGYISSWFANHPGVPITPNGINKSDYTHYGWVLWGVPEGTKLNDDHYFMKTNVYSLFFCKSPQTSDKPTDRLQIRLVKTPGKTWKFNKS